jgi:hypothetical protein
MVQGLLGGKQVAIQTPLKSEDDPEAVEFLHCAIDTIIMVLRLANRYADVALQLRRIHLNEMLQHVPANPPRNFPDCS